MTGTGERLGVVLSTVTDAAISELVALGQLAEAQGYAAVLVNEGRGDALAASQAIAAATDRILVGTNIANIYFRHPFLCAATSRTISELSGGRLLLGLGMSHRGMLASLGIEMGDARQTYATQFSTQAQQTTVDALSTLSRVFPVPSGLGPLTGTAEDFSFFQDPEELGKARWPPGFDR